MPQVLPPGSPRAVVSPFSRMKGLDVFKPITNRIKINSNLHQSLTGSFLELSEGKTASGPSRVQPGGHWLAYPGSFLKYLINRASRLVRSAVFTSCGCHESRLYCDKLILTVPTLSTLFESRSISRCVAHSKVFYISLPCECGPLDWQEFRQVLQTSF